MGIEASFSGRDVRGFDRHSNIVTTESQLDAPSFQPNNTAEYIRSPSQNRRRATHGRSLDSTTKHTQSPTSSPALTLDTISSSSHEPDRPFLLDGLATYGPYVAYASSPTSVNQDRLSVVGSVAKIAADDGEIAEQSSEAKGDGLTFRDTMDPQLVMPSPEGSSRRPFTTVGRSLGKLRIVVAGQSSSGKTSLIQAIIKSCEHIIHCDEPSRARDEDVTEVFASTKPRMWWMHASKSMTSPSQEQRYSAGDVLDRNICFVDIKPSETDNEALTRSTMQYVKSTLNSLLKRRIEDVDLKALVSAGAEEVVDLVFYLLRPDHLTQFHIDCIRQLEQWTNVVPLLACSDELSPNDIERYKTLIRMTLLQNDIDFFRFPTHPQRTSMNTGVYAVSTMTHQDRENMDTSMLMSSEYSPPLVATELSQILEEVFSIEGSSLLRFRTASKVQSWRKQLRGLAQSALVNRHTITVNATTRRSDDKHHLPHYFWNRIEVSNWASGLRRSLDNETICFTSLERSFNPNSAPTSRQLMRRSKSSLKAQAAMCTVNQDPLGLLELIEQVNRGGRVTLELLSTLGLVAYVAAKALKPDQLCNDGTIGFFS